MTKEIYEKKHLFMAVLDTGLYGFVFVFALLMLILLPSGEDISDWPAWANVVFWAFMYLLFFFILVMAPREIWIRYKRYTDLCIHRQPAVIISDSDLQIYSPSGDYQTYSWDEIARFKIIHAKNFNSCRPLYRESWRNPKWWQLLFGINHSGIRTDYLEISETALLTELNSHLSPWSQQRL